MAGTVAGLLGATNRQEVILCELEPKLTLLGFEREQSYADTIMARSGLAGYWRLGEASGATAVDASGNGFDGTYSGGVTLGQPAPLADGDTSALFDGTDGKVTTPLIGFATGPFALEAWAKLNVGSSDAGIVGSGAPARIQLVWHVGTVVYFYAGGSWANFSFSDTTAWHHLVGTWDGTTNANGIKLYIDGVLVSQGTASITTPGDSQISIGKASTFFNGSIDECAAYTRVLTADEVAESYALRTAVVGENTPTYSITAPRQTQTAQVVGGLYRPVVGVEINGTALSAQSSIATVNATAGSYWWDEANEALYVRTSTDAAPDTFAFVAATVRLYFATTPITLEQVGGSPTTAVYYQPWLTGDVPQVRRQVEDLLSGLTTFPSGNVAFTNGHRAWYSLVASDGLWNWKNTLAKFYVGGSYNGLTLARADYAPIAAMLVEDVAPTETVCVFLLQPLRRLTELELPVTPLFETAYPNLGNGVRGTKKWIGYGRATIKPDLTDTVTSQGVYTIADAAYQTLFAVNAVYAIRKDTGAWTTLIEATHYTKDLTACTVTIISATYPHADYEIAVDVTGKPDGSGSYLRTYGPIVQDILTTHLGVAASDLDAAEFATVAIDASADLALWIKSPRTIASLLSTSEPEFASLGRSVMGTVQQTAAGLWTARIWNPNLDTITTTLRREDLAKFEPKPKLKAVFSAVRVYYGYDHAKQQWSVVEITDPTIQYKTGSRDRLELFTYLVSESNARTIAQRYMLLASAVTVEADFEERGALLAQLNAGDKVYITYTPAPTVTGSYESQPFEVLDLVVRYSPKLSVTGLLGNLRGLGGKVGRWTASTAPAWASATEAERSVSGFWSNSSGYVDAADATTLKRSIWW